MNKRQIKLMAVVESDYKTFYGNVRQFSDGTWSSDDIMTIKLNDDFSLPFDAEKTSNELATYLQKFVNSVAEAAQKKEKEHE